MKIIFIIVIHDMSWLCAHSQGWKGTVFSRDNETINNISKQFFLKKIKKISISQPHSSSIHSDSMGRHLKAGPHQREVWNRER